MGMLFSNMRSTSSTLNGRSRPLFSTKCAEREKRRGLKREWGSFSPELREETRGFRAKILANSHEKFNHKNYKNAFF